MSANKAKRAVKDIVPSTSSTEPPSKKPNIQIMNDNMESTGNDMMDATFSTSSTKPNTQMNAMMDSTSSTTNVPHVLINFDKDFEKYRNTLIRKYAKDAQNAMVDEGASRSQLRSMPESIGNIQTTVSSSSFSTKALLRQHNPTLLVTQEEEYQFKQYDGYPNVPKYVAKIPFSEVFDVKKYIAQCSVITGSTLFQQWKGRISAWLTRYKWNTPQNYSAFFGNIVFLNYEYPRYLPFAQSERWNNDIVWAQRFINGPNPVMIKKILANNEQSILNEFNFVSASFKEFLDQSNINKKAAYFVDYSVLQGITEYTKEYFLSAPMVLLVENDKGDLIPVAIKIKPITNEFKDAKIILNTPATNGSNHWTIAKMVVGNADSNYHEVVTHLGFTHLLLEPIAIAAHRKFSAGHQLFQMLLPHFHRTMFVNNLGRSTLISNDEDVEFSLNNVASIGVNGAKQLLDKVYANGTFNFWNTTCFLYNLRDRGFLNITPGKNNGPEKYDFPDKLNKYYYRDDGLKVWKCMESYVRNCVKSIYHTNEELMKDEELKSWLLSCRNEAGIAGFPILDTAFPGGIKNVDDLIRLITSIIWTASAQHAAVNFIQYHYYAFAPNAPLILLKEIMPIFGEQDPEKALKAITQHLAPAKNQIEILALAKVLTISDTNEDYYLTQLQEWENNPLNPCYIAFKTFYNDFIEDLTKVEADIKQANLSREFKYDYLAPSKIPASISV